MELHSSEFFFSPGAPIYLSTSINLNKMSSKISVTLMITLCNTPPCQSSLLLLGAAVLLMALWNLAVALHGSENTFFHSNKPISHSKAFFGKSVFFSCNLLYAKAESRLLEEMARANLRGSHRSPEGRRRSWLWHRRIVWGRNRLNLRILLFWTLLTLDYFLFRE